MVLELGEVACDAHRTLSNGGRLRRGGWCAGGGRLSADCASASASALGYTAQGHFDLGLHHLPKRGAQEGLRQVLNMLRDTFAESKHGQILREVVAIVQEEVVGLDGRVREMTGLGIRALTSGV